MLRFYAERLRLNAERENRETGNLKLETWN